MTWLRDVVDVLPPAQVSVLTDQVEVQGEKIRDLDMCLDEHREKLNATEELLQQVGRSTTAGRTVLFSCSLYERPHLNSP